MSCPQDIASSLVLSSKDASDSLRQLCCLYFLLFQECFQFWDMFHTFGTCLLFFLQEQVCSSTILGHESLTDPLWSSYQSLHMEWSQFFGSSVGCLELLIWFRSLCYLIRFQAVLACASCARPLGSGNRCSTVHLVRSTSFLLSSFSSFTTSCLSYSTVSCRMLLVAFLGKPRFGLKISLKSLPLTLL